MAIEKIWITGNILDHTAEAYTNALILETTLFFRRLIESVTGLDVQPFYMQKEVSAPYDALEDIDRENNEGPLQQNTSEYVWNCFQDSLVITYEPGLLACYLDALRIPYIALRLSPLGFLEDAHYAFCSNIPAIHGSLAQYRMPAEEIHANVQKQKLYYGLQPVSFIIEQNALLFCADGAADAPAAQDSGYCKSAAALLEAYEHIYYKPLGGAQKYAKRDAWMQECSQVRLVDAKLYRLLCDERIVAVASASSGVLDEAAYFGKRLHLLSQEAGGVKADTWILLRNDYFASAFWADILSSVLQTTPGNWQRFLAPDVLRSTTGRWGEYETGVRHDAVRSLQQEYNDHIAKSDMQATILQSMGGAGFEMVGMQQPWKERLHIKGDIANLRLHINALRKPFARQEPGGRLP